MTSTPSASRVEAPSSSWRRFLLGAFGTGLFILVAVGLVNYAVDPPRTGTAQRGDIVETDGKVDLLLDFDEPLDFVLLGPSPMQRFDPKVVTMETGATGFNAAITASPISDSVQIAKYLKVRSKERDEPFPHLVYGFSVEAFGPHPDDQRDIGLPIVEETTFVDDVRARLQDVARLIQWGTFKRSVQLIRDGKARPSTREDEGASTADIDPRVREDGYLTSGPFLGPRGKQPLPELREATYQQYLGFYEVLARDGTDRVNPAGAAAFEELLRVANDAGDEPTIVVLPFAQELAEAYGPIARDAFLQTLGAYIDDLATEYDFTILSLEDLSQFGFDDTALYDGVHPRPKLADAFMQFLAKQDPLLAPREEG